MKIVSIKKVSKPSMRYDLEVAKNENFFANSVLVHNCSMTVYVMDGDVGVCSRNLDLKHNIDNSLWRAAYKHELPAKLANIGRNIAIQGELVGNGIQGNKYKMRDQDFYVYDVYDIATGQYFTPTERKVFVTALDLLHCPVFNTAVEIDVEIVADLLAMAEGKSVMGDITGPEREGLVFKCNEKELSFKVISNKFLMKHGD